MTVTPIIPAPTGLAGDLETAAEAVALAVTAMQAAGEGAKAFTRVALTVASKETVDNLAGRWGVTARWSAEKNLYVARKFLGDRSAEVEAVYHTPAKQAPGNEAAA